EVIATDDASLAQRRVELLYGQRAGDGELIEVGVREERLEAGNGANALLGVVGAAQTLLTQLAEAGLAQRGKLDGTGERQQCLVCADVGGGALAADVLLARLEGKDIAALAPVVHGLAHEAAGQPTDECGLGSEEADGRSAVANGIPQALPLGGDDIGAIAGG